jgi:hypothetical protein
MMNNFPFMLKKDKMLFCIFFGFFCIPFLAINMIDFHFKSKLF